LIQEEKKDKKEKTERFLWRWWMVNCKLKRENKSTKIMKNEGIGYSGDKKKEWRAKRKERRGKN